jgi:hypothetical protein
MMSRRMDGQWCMSEKGGTGSGRNSRGHWSYVLSRLHALGAGSLMQPLSCILVAYQQGTSVNEHFVRY